MESVNEGCLKKSPLGTVSDTVLQPQWLEPPGNFHTGVVHQWGLERIKMARIRTIKPEFFTSEDIVSLSPLARLLYIALWCEADKEGRLVWKPMTFKLRYMPGDACDIQSLCSEIVDRGLVRQYGDGLAYIPSFSAHQHINPRESASQLPDHKEQPRVGTRQPRVGTSANLNMHPQVGREGKGRINTPIPPSGAEPIPEKQKTAAVALPTWLESIKVRGEKPIPEDDPVFAYAEQVGIPQDHLRLCWKEFRHRYSQAGAKRYRDWRSVFRKAVRGNWLKLWWVDGDGAYMLTTVGKQAEKVAA